MSLSTPNIKGNEWKYVKECLDTEWVSSAGKYVELFEEKISEYTGAKYAIACVNGTSALQLSFLLAGVKENDEVIVPTLTFIATVNAIVYNRAKPIFMDADNFCNIDKDKTIEFIKDKTIFKEGFTYNISTKNRISAISPVHVWGNAANLDELFLLCKERNIKIVEDASESLGTIYTKGLFKGKHTGIVGELGCISFNGNKIITTGGGGMILTNDPILATKARYLSTQAKDDEVRYIHNQVGYNFRLTNVQAAIGVAQMEQLPKFLDCKKEIHSTYKNELKKINGLSLLETPDYSKNNNWINLLKIDSKQYGKNTEDIRKLMDKKGIQTRPIWKLNHLQNPYKSFFSYKIENAEKLVNNSLCLPSSTNLANEDLIKIIETL